MKIIFNRSSKGIWRLVISLAFSCLMTASGTRLPSIEGIWICDTDRNWKLVFTTKNKCYQYYTNKLIEVDTFIISNTSPQCGKSVPIETNTSYLRLTNMSDPSDAVCYEINGITNKNLSITTVGKGSATVFTRQVQNRTGVKPR